MICPKCKSKNVSINSNSEWDGSGKFICNECRFTGDIFPEED